MSIWDDRILEYIRENEGGRVGEMYEQDLFRVSKSQISRRCRRLADHGLLRPLGNGVYIMTDDGRRYLDEELDAGELQDTSEENGEATA